MPRGVARLVRYVLWPLVLALSLFLLVPGRTQAAIRAALESPENGQAASGIAIIRGWAFATRAGVQISSVELFIDGVRSGNIPCCSERADVRAAFPQFPATNTLNSGWGITVNWGIVSSGSHTVRVDVKTTAGESFSAASMVTVVKPGDFEFLDQFDLSGAFVGSDDQDIVVEEAQIRDKATGQLKLINARFRWEENCQCLGMVETEE